MTVEDVRTIGSIVGPAVGLASLITMLLVTRSQRRREFEKALPRYQIDMERVSDGLFRAVLATRGEAFWLSVQLHGARIATVTTNPNQLPPDDTVFVEKLNDVARSDQSDSFKRFWVRPNVDMPPELIRATLWFRRDGKRLQVKRTIPVRII